MQCNAEFFPAGAKLMRNGAGSFLASTERMSDDVMGFPASAERLRNAQ